MSTHTELTKKTIQPHTIRTSFLRNSEDAPLEAKYYGSNIYFIETKDLSK